MNNAPAPSVVAKAKDSAWAMKLRIYPTSHQEQILRNILFVRHKFRNEAVSFLQEPLRLRREVLKLDPSTYSMLGAIEWRNADHVSRWLTERLGKARDDASKEVDFPLHKQNMRSTLSQWSRGEIASVEGGYLLTVQRTVLDQVVQDLKKTLDKAIKDRVNGLSKPAGMPKFHKFRFASSFRMQVVASKNKAVQENWKAGLLYLPDIGALKFRDNLTLPTTCPSQVTISRNACGQWFASMFVKENNHQKSQEKSFSALSQKPLPMDESGDPVIVGIDLGVKTLAVDSTGKEYQNNKHLKRYQAHRAHNQRNLARKTKGSRRWQRQRNYVATIENTVKNSRHDDLVKTAKQIVDSAAIVCLEDLSIANMLKNRKLARAISDAGIGKLCSLIEMRAKREGKLVLYCDRFDPTSQLCSTMDCSYRYKELTLSERDWTCPDCNTHHDRDHNAAKNIVLLALSNEKNQRSVECTDPNASLHPQLKHWLARGGANLLGNQVASMKRESPTPLMMSGTSPKG